MFASRLTTPVGVCVWMGILSAPLWGGTVAFELRIGGGKNAPIFRWLNNSSAVEITRCEISIGDEAFNYDDFTLKTLSSATHTSSSVDSSDGGARSNVLSFDFSQFDPGQSFRIKTDIDIDDQATKEDYNQILFQLGGNDPSNNARVSVDFSDGTTLSDNLPDYESKPPGSYIFALSRTTPDDGPPPAIPLPPAFWAGLGLLGGLGAVSLARKTFRRIS